MESGIHRHGIRNPQRGIRNPRLSWITLHGARFGRLYARIGELNDDNLYRFSWIKALKVQQASCRFLQG